MFKLKNLRDERGITPVLGAALVIAMVITAFSAFLMVWIPSETNRREYEHMMEVGESFLGLKSKVEGLSVGGSAIMDVRMSADSLPLVPSPKGAGRVFVSSGICKAKATESLTPSDDTYVAEGSPGSNFGSGDSFRVASMYNNDKRAFLKFSLENIPTGAEVLKAELWLYCKDYGSPLKDMTDVECYSVNDDEWSEANVTWNNPPTKGFPVRNLLDRAYVNEVGWICFTVKDFVTLECGGDKIVSLSLKAKQEDYDDNERYVNFFSKDTEKENKRPYLEIAYLLYDLDNWAQTDWSGGGTGGGSPEVVTGTVENYYRGENENVADGEIKLENANENEYKPSGYIESSVYDAGTLVDWRIITWTEDMYGSAGDGAVGPGSITRTWECSYGVDDGSESNGSWGYTGSYLYVGKTSSSTYHSAYRWRDVDIPQGSSISSASIFADVYAYGPADKTIIVGIDEDYTDDLSTNPMGRPETTAQVAWDNFSGSNETSPDISAIIQEIVDRPGWAPGNALAVKHKDDGSTPTTKPTYIYSADSWRTGPKLTVTYTPPPMVVVQTRTGMDNDPYLDNGDPDLDNWSGWENCTSGQYVPSPEGRYIQYRVKLQTPYTSLTPVVKEITIYYLEPGAEISGYGRIGFDSGGGFRPGQTYVYEAGGLILIQDGVDLMVSKPTMVTASDRSGGEIRVDVNFVVVKGEDASTTSTGTKTVKVSCERAYHTVIPVGNRPNRAKVLLKLSSNYRDAWGGYLRETCEELNAKGYNASVSGLTLTILGRDNAAGVKDIFYYEKVTEVEVYIT